MSSRCPTPPPVPCVAPLNCSASSTPPGRSPSVWILTAAWASLCGACAGKRAPCREGLEQTSHYFYRFLRSQQSSCPTLQFKQITASNHFCCVVMCAFACASWFQRVLGPPVDPGSSPGAGEQCVAVAGGGQPVQSARHLLLVFSHGDVHQRPGLTD